MIPKSFFVTSGKAKGKISKLNTFDLALKRARIHQCNLVNVSSIIPKNCIEKDIQEILPGTITFIVMSKAQGKGEEISSGIVWGKQKKEGYGLVAETFGKMNYYTAKKNLEKKIKEMARVREIKLNTLKYKIETLDIPEDYYGCTIACLVFIL